jgi:hypothetical protein
MQNGAQPLELARTTAFGYSVFNPNAFFRYVTNCQGGTSGFTSYGIRRWRSIFQTIDFLSPFITAVTSTNQQIKNGMKYKKNYVGNCIVSIKCLTNLCIQSTIKQVSESKRVQKLFSISLKVKMKYFFRAFF